MRARLCLKWGEGGGGGKKKRNNAAPDILCSKCALPPPSPRYLISVATAAKGSGELEESLHGGNFVLGERGGAVGEGWRGVGGEEGGCTARALRYVCGALCGMTAGVGRVGRAASSAVSRNGERCGSGPGRWGRQGCAVRAVPRIRLIRSRCAVPSPRTAALWGLRVLRRRPV